MYYGGGPKGPFIYNSVKRTFCYMERFIKMQYIHFIFFAYLTDKMINYLPSGNNLAWKFLPKFITSKLLIAFYKHDISLRKTHSK